MAYNGNNAQFVGLDAVMAQFDRMLQVNDVPCFSVWRGKDLLFPFNGTNEDDARAFFFENMAAAQQAGNNSLFKVRFHPKPEKGVITDKTPYSASFLCCVNEYSYTSSGGNSGNRDVVDMFKQQMNEMRSEIAALKSSLEETDDEDDEGDTMNGIAKLLDHPLAGHIIGLIENFLPKPNPQLSASIGNIQHTEFEQALIKLKELDADIESDLIKLSLIAEKKPTFFKMILSQLRKMKV